MNDLFPIAPVSTLTAPALTDRAERIRSLVNVVRGCIVEIGRELIEAKADVGHGNWLRWLHDEFGWDQKTAWNYMRVTETFGGKLGTVPNLNDLTIEATALYALAAPDAPQAARDEAIERAETGDPRFIRRPMRCAHTTPFRPTQRASARSGNARVRP